MILCPSACDIREMRTENSSDGALLQLAIDSAPALSSSSCAVDFTTLYEVDKCPMTLKEPPTVALDDEAHDDDDEGFDNEAFDNDEEDEGDALQGEGGRSSRGKWTAEEDETLRDAVQRHGGRNWKRISDCLEGRTDVQCLHRWQKVLRPGLIKGPWTKEEDDNVCDLVGKHGMKSWSFIARQLKGRLGKQCRERWYNHLNPDINRAPWSAEEDAMIIEEHKKKGNKWAEIAKAITGRTDNAIKNRWNSTLQRIILQKSAEWTPKKSKKKPRGEDEIEGEGETPGTGTGSLKARRSSVKKSKVKKIVEEEEIEDEDEHSDANILLLLSASKMSVSGGKAKVLKAKSPSKRALKLLIKEAEAEQDNIDSGLTSTSTSPHKKQKFKRIMKQFVSSISNAPPGVQESGSRIQNVEISLWSPGGLVLKTECQKNPVDVDYLSPRPEREEICIDGDDQRNSDCLALFSAGPAQRETADLPRGKRRLQCNSAPHPSAPINFDDYDWTSANSFGQPAKRKKYTTKKTTETNDAAAVLSLAPLIQVIGNSLDLEDEGEHQEGQDGGTTCSSDDVEREWDGEGDEEISSTSTEALTESEDHPLSSSLCTKSNEGVVAAAAGSFEAVPQVSPQAIESFSSTGIEEQKDDEEKQFFRAELLLTMRTPSITHVHT